MKKLSDLLSYNKASGSLVWNKRPVEWFSSPGAARSWNTQHAGKPAGATGTSEYSMVKIMGRGVAVHRVVWELNNGPIPAGMDIDHIDRDKRNNRIENLRIASRSQNMLNTGILPTNTSGHKGVYWHKRLGKWQAAITVRGRNVYLGVFADISDAAAAYRKRAEDLMPRPQE